MVGTLRSAVTLKGPKGTFRRNCSHVHVRSKNVTAHQQFLAWDDRTVPEACAFLSHPLKGSLNLAAPEANSALWCETAYPAVSETVAEIFAQGSS
jgi:hypothetical protein